MNKWIGDIVTDRDGLPTAWVSFEPDFGWVVYPLAYFRRCIPEGNEEAYTAMNHGMMFGGGLPDDPWALPSAAARVSWIG